MTNPAYARLKWVLSIVSVGAAAALVLAMEAHR